MKRNRVPAPRRKVASKELISPNGLWGNSNPYYLVRLECGHVYHKSPARADAAFIYCKKCLEGKI